MPKCDTPLEWYSFACTFACTGTRTPRPLAAAVCIGWWWRHGSPAVARPRPPAGAAVANAGWFNQPLMIGAHALFSAFLIVKTKALETEGFTKAAVQRYYQNIWYLFYSEYLILPFI